MKTCTRCGAENPDQRSACIDCYAPLDRKFTPIVKTEAKPAGQKSSLGPAFPASAPRRSSPVLWVLPLILALAAAGGAAWYFLLRPTPEKAFKAFMAATTTNPASAYNMLTSDSQQILPQELFSNSQITQTLPTAPTTRIDSVTNNGDTAEVNVTVTRAPPAGMAIQLPPQQQTVYMAQENGQWKVDLKQTLKDQMSKLPADLRARIAATLSLGGPKLAPLAALIEGTPVASGRASKPGARGKRKRPNAKAGHLPSGGIATGAPAP